MSLTPQDIQQQKFKTKFRGYDVDEVDGFLAEVAEILLAVQDEQALLQEKLTAVEKKHEQLLQEQQELQATIGSAEKAADELKQKGRQDAEALISRAREEIKAKHEEISGERAKIKADKDRGLQDAAALVARAKEEIKAKKEETENERAKIAAEMEKSRQDAEKLIAEAGQEINTLQQEAEATLANTKAEIEEFNAMKSKIREELHALLSRFLKQLDSELPASALSAPFSSDLSAPLASDSLDIIFETEDEPDLGQGLDEEILMQLFQGVDAEPGSGEETTGRPDEDDDDLSDLYQTIDLSDVIGDQVQGTLEELNENLVLAEEKTADPEAAENQEANADTEKHE
jgi:cell division initiation protein